MKKSVKYLGDKFVYHRDWEGEDNCAVCNKPLISGYNNYFVICLDVNNYIISKAVYDRLYEAQAVQVGMSCARQFDKSVFE